MKKYIVKKVHGKGGGLFASKDIKKDEILFHVDLSKQKSYTPEEIAKMPNNDHADYIGRGRYVLSFHPYSYMNHSCDPNIVIKHESLSKNNFIAMRNIKKGEELTYDYGVNALDHIGKGGYVSKGAWTIECKCGSKKCRKKISADFLKQPIEIQRKYYKYLPPAIKRRYKDKFNKLTK
ncbi:MAG: SET domain-containing protein-lysine N-methyltransferase [Nanoarchaeota archaeon]|nr:SET domain-containing protein-lysine N-methyltransferase [Nanoarchaeota archaeon]